MEYQELGTSGIKVSEVTLGTWSFGWPGSDTEQSIKTIHSALNNGINFIDTAGGYGNPKGSSERIIGEALKGRRKDAVICTKVSIIEHNADYSNKRFGYDFVMRNIEQNLERLQTDYIDVYLSHFYNPHVSIEETMRVFSDLRDQKVIRAFGVSKYDIPELQEIAKYTKIDVGQYDLSIFQRRFNEPSAPDHPPASPIEPVLKYANENNISLMCFGTVTRGLLSGRFTGTEHFPKNDPRHQDPIFQGDTFQKHIDAVEKMRPIAQKHGKSLAQLAINWALHQPGVTTALVGGRTPEQMTENAGASGWQLDQEDILEIEKLVKSLQKAQ